MPTPPTFVAEYESAWNTSTTPKTISVTTAVNDVLVACGTTENTTSSLNTPTGGTSLTWTLQQSNTAASCCACYLWTATATTAESFTFSLTKSGGAGDWWGFNVMRWSGSDGVGASAKGGQSDTPSLALTTTTANAALAFLSGDFQAADGTSRTWRTVNSITPTAGNGLELSYFRDSVHYASYVAYWSDAGAAGAKTLGISAPVGQLANFMAVEVKGTASAAATIPDLVTAQIRR